MVYVLLLVSFLLPAHAAIVSSVSNIPDFVNLTLANESSLPSDRFAIESNTWEWYCSPSHRWNQPPMELGDCRGMLGLFYYETMMDGGRTSMEFISPGAKKTRKMKGQMTPRKYTFGKHITTKAPFSSLTFLSTVFTSHINLPVDGIR